LAFALFFNPLGTLAAGTTGTISGTVTNATTTAPVPGVHVTAVSLTGRYETTTDAKGFFSITGVISDTYTVSFELTGFQSYSTTGVNVFADTAANVSVAMQKSLSTIGHVVARSPGGAYQPTQTQDTYTVTSQQITTQLGKSDQVSETSLLVSLPGASLDSSGYPVLRGGRENEEGFQFEGIDYTDAFTSQFINSLAIDPSIGQLQLIPGAGDASNGNSGTGVINLISKRGTSPPFGSIDVEALAQPYGHKLALEYGFATPNGRFSNYVSFLGNYQGFQDGARGSQAIHLGTGAFYGTELEVGADIVDNMVYKFGRNNSQSLQFFYQNQRNEFYGNYGGFSQLSYPQGDPFLNHYIPIYTGVNSAQLCQYLQLLPYQPAPLPNPAGSSIACSSPLDKGPINYHQPNDTMKFQYSNNLDASTYLSAKVYRTNAVVTFDFPFDEPSIFPFQSFFLKQGGQRTGGTLDLQKQFNSQNLVQVGAKFDYLHPTYDQVDPLDGLFAISTFSQQYEAADFINPSDPACPLGPGGCGYLWQNFPGGPQWAATGPGPWARNNEASVTNRQDWSAYLLDNFSPNDRLKINAGIRFDGTHYRLPALTGCQPTSYLQYRGDPTTSTPGIGNYCNYAPSRFITDANGTYPYTDPLPNEEVTPIVFEPRLAFTYQVTRNDDIRASFGRSVEFPSLGDVDLQDPVGVFSAFMNVPSFNIFTGLPATSCGVLGNVTCANYAYQLKWDNQNYLAGVPIQPLRPETFTNWEASYSHQFPANISMKITPFYRRGFDQVAFVALPLIDPTTGQPELNPNGAVIFGPATATNNGISKTSGIEFYLTKEAAYGLSGELSATYINELSNVIPDSASEDFFPSIPAQSLELGNVYRVGFLSPFQATLALSYKTHSGWRLNPIVSYNKGYPIGAGFLTSTFLGATPYNVPNTNVTSPTGTTGADRYVDPLNPGTIFNPNIAASRGTPDGASAGGFLSAAHFNTNVSLEFNPPGSHNTFGVLVTNVFNQLYGIPGLNTRWQPVANGVGGPKTGYSSTYTTYPYLGVDPRYADNRYGYDPYLIGPTGAPTTFRFYYQLAL